MSRDPSLFINRELSWLAFNARVLKEARRKDVPICEQLRFLAIAANNLDEFFMVRVAALRSRARAGRRGKSPDGLTARQQLDAISRQAHRHVKKQYRALGRLLPALGELGITVLTAEELVEEQRAYADDFFERRVMPVLTPLVVDQSHPFPWIANLSLNLAVMVSRKKTGRRLAIVQVPRTIPRLIQLPSAEADAFLLLEELIVMRLGDLFPGGTIQDWTLFRLTRDAELEVDPEEVQDFRKAMESEIQRRKRSGVVRMEVRAGQGETIAKRVAAKVRVKEPDIYELPGPLDLRFLNELMDLEKLDAHQYPPFEPARRPALEEEDLWALIRKGDILLHHPYESFDPVERFISEAADDPDVLAIKMTLYRMGQHSAIMDGLLRAAERDKQVAVLVELLARFDEERNLEWAQRLERAGAHVIYGVAGLKTHAKIALVVRRESGGIRRYLHLGTGNYNARTARLYSDFSLFTCDEDFGVDASGFFNVITGYSDPPRFRRFAMAPLQIRSRILELIAREADHARAGVPAEIVIKVNSLVDPEMIEALYAASQAGVDVKLLVRGICCLRPGVKGVSDRITVQSVVDRFLEHTRIYYFRNASHEEVYLSSADLMQRNLDKRVELLFPVLAEGPRERLRTILMAYLSDNSRAWLLKSDGTYQQAGRRKGEPTFRIQQHLMEEGRRASGMEQDAAFLQFRPRVRHTG